MKAALLWLLMAIPASAQVVFTYSAPGPVPASYFGITCGHPQTVSPGCIPAGTMRTWDASGWGQANSGWAALETAAGVFNWTVLDNVVASASTYSSGDVLFTVGNVPSWNSSNPSDSSCAEGNGSCDPNSSDAAFIVFMNAAVQRYCGTVKYWEGWNEANSQQSWNAPVTLLATYMNAMYIAVHSTANCACASGSCSPGLAGGTNPNKVLTPALSSPALFSALELNNGSSGYNQYLSNWLATYLAAGALYDIAALHSYGSDATCYAGPEGYVTDVASFKQMFAARGAAPPVWNTELNWGLNACAPTGAGQNSWIARYMLLHAAIGVERAIWYVYDTGATFGAIAPGSSQLTTYQDMQLWMTGANESCSSYVDGTWVCSLTRSGYKGYAVWNQTGTGSYTVPTGVTQYRDVLNSITATTAGSTVALTDSPKLFETGTIF